MADAPDVAGLLRYGETVTETLAAEQSVIWQFWGDVDDVVEIKLTPLEEDDDLLFILQDPAANTILEVDAALAGGSEQAAGFTIPVEGRWGLVIKEFFGDEGAYTLTINRTRR